MQGKSKFSWSNLFANGLGIMYMIPVHSPTATRAKLHHLIVVFFFILFLSLEKVEWWGNFYFFTQLIAIEGKAQFQQQFAPLHPNCGSPYRSERGLGDGVSGRG
jgi:hypothetical protein